MLQHSIHTTTQPSYLHNFITVQPPGSTRSSSLGLFTLLFSHLHNFITVQPPGSTRSSSLGLFTLLSFVYQHHPHSYELRITDRNFWYASPCLWTSYREGRLKTQEWKTREWKSRHHNAGVENAREASMKSHTLTTLTTRRALHERKFFDVIYLMFLID